MNPRFLIASIIVAIFATITYGLGFEQGRLDEARALNRELAEQLVNMAPLPSPDPETPAPLETPAPSPAPMLPLAEK